MNKEMIFEKLNAKKFRITKARERVIETFIENPHVHFTIEQLIEKESEYSSVNVSTMYNTIDFLVSEEIIYETSFHGKRFYEYIVEKNHTHLICRHCHKVVHIDDRTDLSPEDLLTKHGFVTKNLITNSYGCCEKCRKIYCLQCTSGCISKVNVINEFDYEIDERELYEYIDYLKNYFKETRSISLVITNEQEIAELNKYRDKNEPTDVLSFPFEDDRYLGDIFICYSIALEQAAEYNHSIKREIFFLLTHGFLHLQGYDHHEKSDEKKMFALQEKLLENAGIERK